MKIRKSAEWRKNKMKKEKQIKENIIVEEAFATFTSDKKKSCNIEYTRLRSCNAYVSRIGNWLVLKSYDTIVAIIDVRTGVLYDFLRLVYGYTATSSQHISKFENDYSAVERYTWREL